ncbi:right-handed parallel beta-helix repeat-containing protein, partial [bacterium]|nr:right-handed parallel beta-helix repeat-containing protein [bacterium]
VKEAGETNCLSITDEDEASVLAVTLRGLTIRNGVGTSSSNISCSEALTIENCQILGGRIGSGMRIVGVGSLTMRDSLLSGHETTSAGGGLILQSANEATLERCTLSQNRSEGSGGAVSLSNNSNLILIDSIVSDNRGSRGGAIQLFNSDGNFSGTTFSNNEINDNGNGGSGGAIFSDGSGIGNDIVTLSRCTIVGNSSAGNGGAISARNCAINISHCTIVENTAPEGQIGGVQLNFATELNMSFSILRDNTGGDIARTNSGNGGINSLGQNLVGTGDGISNFGESERNTEPLLLAPLANYGGFTETRPPLPDSPAIDGATDSDATLDQRGLPIIDGAPDIGAAEFISASFIIVTTNIDELNTPASAGTGISLREAIRDSSSGNTITFDPSLDGQPILLDALKGQLVIDKSLNIDASALANGITIDGGSNGDLILDENETRCFFISDDDNNMRLEVTFNNLTIQNGVFEAFDEKGAGANIHNRENLILVECNILNGRAFGIEPFGGGIFSEVGNLTMTDCIVSGNQTEGDIVPEGGGIYSNIGNLTLTNCTVSNNQTQGEFAEGGGIFTQANNCTLTNCTISDNLSQGEGSSGGGIAHFRGNLTLTNCTVSGNQTEGEGAIGGGISIFLDREEQTARLTRCTITGNSALDADGGGLFFTRFGSEGGRTIIEHCTIVGNSGMGMERESLAMTMTASKPRFLTPSFEIIREGATLL